METLFDGSGMRVDLSIIVLLYNEEENAGPLYRVRGGWEQGRHVHEGETTGGKRSSPPGDQVPEELRSGAGDGGVDQIGRGI